VQEVTTDIEEVLVKE